ncbi:MAG: carbohydrate kinase [Ruminococcaceae bacterium]|nr:carbohydrate kinase [Oscillospiraceae bacterium]
MKKYVLAYDLGTSGVKGALVTPEGEVAYTATVSYPLYTADGGVAEQDPADYWQGVCAVTGAVLKKSGVTPEAVLGIAFDTMWKGIIPIDGAGNVLHRSIIWLDSRSVEEAALLNQRFGEDTFNAADYWPKLFWLRRHRPEVIEGAAMILEVNSYLKWKATGVASVDVANGFVSSFDPKLDAFYADVLDFMDIPREKFPATAASEALVGHVTEAASAELGLPAGVPVFGGTSDINAIAMGAGTAAVGGVHIYFGSSGWIGYTLAHQFRQLYHSPFDEKRDINIVSSQSIGLSFNWAVDRFYAEEKKQMGDGVFAFVDKQLEEIPAGSEGVFATPWFYGERPPLFGRAASGNFLGLGAAHDRRHMTRAVMEGVCYQLRMGAEYQEKTYGYRLPETVRVVGGGACSSLWMQMLADVLGVTVEVPAATRHAGALGTAYCALVGLGLCADMVEAGRGVRIGHVYTPNPAAAAVYDRGYAVFENIYGTLAPLFADKN